MCHLGPSSPFHLLCASILDMQRSIQSFSSWKLGGPTWCAARSFTDEIESSTLLNVLSTTEADVCVYEDEGGDGGILEGECEEDCSSAREGAEEEVRNAGSNGCGG